jgi:hypothetical protein
MSNEHYANYIRNELELNKSSVCFIMNSVNITIIKTEQIFYISD